MLFCKPVKTEYKTLQRASPVALLVKNPPANTIGIRDKGLDPWVGKIAWRRTWQPTLVFLSGACAWCHVQRSLEDHSITENQTRQETQHACTKHPYNIKVFEWVYLNIIAKLSKDVFKLWLFLKYSSPSTIFLNVLFWGEGGATPCGIQDLSSQPGIKLRLPAVETQSPNHWTTKEYPPTSPKIFKRKFRSIIH